MLFWYVWWVGVLCSTSCCLGWVLGLFGLRGFRGLGVGLCCDEGFRVW